MQYPDRLPPFFPEVDFYNLSPALQMTIITALYVSGKVSFVKKRNSFPPESKFPPGQVEGPSSLVDIPRHRRGMKPGNKPRKS